VVVGSTWDDGKKETNAEEAEQTDDGREGKIGKFKKIRGFV
jgi:hypothetical protein